MSVQKYAKPEIERRFRLEAVPLGATDPVEVTDRYLEGGHLRLRCVQVPGQPPLFKLGHKLRPDPADAGVVLHTSMYLTVTEHAMLDALPGRALRKTRYQVDVAGRNGAVDVFHGHEGLVLLEVGFVSEEEARQWAPPSWVGPESDLCGADLAD